MDLETENRIAAILLKEAAELRRQAQREGALAYLRQPTVRSRPNSRFLTATVRGVQQANRVVEVNEMWRLREKQLELDNRLTRARNERNTSRNYKDAHESSRNRSSSCNEPESSRSASLSTNKRDVCVLDYTDDEGLRDDEVDEFLYSRTKRGRGAVGSRMDEPGPYLPTCPDSKASMSDSTLEEKKKVRIDPQKPHHLKSSESFDDESDKDTRRKNDRGSTKGHSNKHRSKEKSRHKRKKKEKKHRYH